MALVLTLAAIAGLLVLVLKVRLPAFVALLLVSLAFGLLAGLPPGEVVAAVQAGMGGTLGFVAVVVGLGAMMGVLLERSGGVEAISDTLLARFGEGRTQGALGLIGFLVAIPVFFDVAFILLVPVLAGLTERTGRSVVYYAIPLLAGLAVTHAFVPPTPGPIAVAEILGADLGYVILFGALAGLPAMLVAGPWLARRIAERADMQGARPVQLAMDGAPAADPIGFGAAMSAIVLPLLLILGSTAATALGREGPVADAVRFVGHPFVALLIAVLYAWYLFGVRRGMDRADLHDAMLRALEPAGLVVLVTGAGGVFKQVLVDSGAGAELAATLDGANLPLVAFAFAVAGIVRVAQGSATVAMITGAGLTAPIAQAAGVEGAGLAVLVVAIASGASILSHVNDSGFWLVSRYLGLTEAQTLRSWTVSTTLIGLTGFAVSCILALVV